MVTHSKSRRCERTSGACSGVSFSPGNDALAYNGKVYFPGWACGVGWWTSAALITSVQTEPKPDPERFYSNNKRMCRKVQLMWELKGTSVHFMVALFPLIVKTSQLPQFLLRSEDLLTTQVETFM